MEDTLVIHSEKRTTVKTLDSKMSSVSLYISLAFHLIIVLIFAVSGGFNDNEQNASSSQAPSQMNIVQATLWTSPVKKAKKTMSEPSLASYGSIAETPSPTPPLPKKTMSSIEQTKKKV
jgi:hypothetical protein